MMISHRSMHSHAHKLRWSKFTQNFHSETTTENVIIFIIFLIVFVGTPTATRKDKTKQFVFGCR